MYYRLMVRGAVMASTGTHDERDHEFAKKFDLPIIEVIEGGNVQKKHILEKHISILAN